MKKKELYRLYRELHDEVRDLNREIARLHESLVEARQMIFAMTDKVMAAEANATLADDMPAKSPTQLRIEEKQRPKRTLAELDPPAAKRVNRIIMDDVIGDTNKTTPPADLDKVREWYHDVISVAYALDEADEGKEFPCDVEPVADNVLTKEQVVEEIQKLAQYEDFPTDDELAQVDALMDELLANRK